MTPRDPEPRRTGGRPRRAARGKIARRVALALALAGGCTPLESVKFWSREKHEPLREPTPVPRVPYAPPIRAVVNEDPVPEAAPEPLTIRNLDSVEYFDLRLEEAVAYSLENAKVMRSLGATLLRNPEGARTRYQTASQYTDPRFGPEAALAAFDAEFATRAFFENNDRVINNRFFGGGTTEFQQDLNVYQTELRKRAATGTLFSLRNNTQYDANNAPANVFPDAWDTNIEGEVRQPLLQGAGLNFNRIAGPDAVPGVYNGVVIARVNNDISQADFEASLRDFLSDVSNAYWELYFAYRDLDARKRARDQAYDVWQRYQARYDADEERGAGTATDRVALAREQYFRFQREAEEALSGRPIPATQTEPGGGALRGNGGVLVAERRLRLLMGWPINDRRLLRPATDPQEVEVLYDWSSIVGEAMTRRTELRRQRLLVNRREQELKASRNFLLPRLDATAEYRFRGFGDDLLGQGDDGRFSNAVDNLTGGDYQEWQLGVEFAVPLGRRRGHAAVQNAELLAARERVVLHEQERQVVHDLSNAIAEKDRAYQAVVTNLDRLNAANVLLESLQVLDRESAGGSDAVSINLDRLLDAQRRVAESETEFYRSLAAYEVSIKNVNYEKGSLFDYHEVMIAGNESSRAATANPKPAASSPSDDYLPSPSPAEPAPAPATEEVTFSPVRSRPRPAAEVAPVANPFLPAEAREEPAGPDEGGFFLEGISVGSAEDDPAIGAGVIVSGQSDDAGASAALGGSDGFFDEPAGAMPAEWE